MFEWAELLRASRRHHLCFVYEFVYEVPCIFWRYINVDEVSLLLSKSYYKVRWNYYKLRQLSLLQSAMDSCYKLRQLYYYKVRHDLLQIATGITNCDGFITNWDRYYKVRWLLQIATVHLALRFIYRGSTLYNEDGIFWYFLMY